jgi:hypothetical protein
VTRSFSYQVKTTASAALAWEVFSNWRRWHTFASIYGKMEWTQGQPWQVGSRLSVEVVQPFHVVIDHVITYCDPGRKVGWIDHALGIAIDQWVEFEPHNGSGTHVRVTGEMVGAQLQLSNGLDVDRFVRDFTRQWYDAYREVCDQLTPVKQR